MEFNWPYLVVGLALLWFPRQWMRLGKIIGRPRRRAPKAEEPWLRREPGDPRLSFREEFSKARNYFDLLRGVAGSLSILGGLGITPALMMAGPVTSRGRWILLAAKLAILLVGLLIQVIRLENARVTFFAPVFFLAGLSVGLCGPWAALFAFIFVWAVNPMLKNGPAFLSLDAVLMFSFGMLLRKSGGPIFPIAAGLLCFLPALLSWMARRPLVVFSRKGFHTGGSS